MVDSIAAGSLGNQPRSEIDKVTPTVVRLFLRKHEATVVHIVSRPPRVRSTDSLSTGIIRVGRGPSLSHAVLGIIDIAIEAVVGLIAGIVVGIAGIVAVITCVETK